MLEAFFDGGHCEVIVTCSVKARSTLVVSYATLQQPISNLQRATSLCWGVLFVPHLLIGYAAKIL